METSFKDYFRENKKEVSIIVVGALLVVTAALISSFLSGDHKLNIPEDFDKAERSVSRLMTRSALSTNEIVKEFNSIVSLEEDGQTFGLTERIVIQKEEIADNRDDLRKMIGDVEKMSLSMKKVTPSSLSKVSSDMTKTAFIATQSMANTLDLLDKLFIELEERIEGGESFVVDQSRREFSDSWPNQVNQLNSEILIMANALKQYDSLTKGFNQITDSYTEEAEESE
jgi:predicted transcriptional regulator